MNEQPWHRGRTSIRATDCVGGSVIGPAIEIAELSRMCLAEGFGVLIWNRLDSLEQFRVGCDKKQ